MRSNRVMMFAAVVEIATALALVFAPMLVVKLLLGVYAPWTSVSIGRLAGIAIFTLGVSCLPAGGGEPGAAPLRAMFAYQALVAAYLAYLSVVGKIGGVMLWPAVVLHAVVAVALAWLGKDRLMPSKGAHGD